jgi:hypothetical protein
MTGSLARSTPAVTCSARDTASLTSWRVDGLSGRKQTEVGENRSSLSRARSQNPWSLERNSGQQAKPALRWATTNSAQNEACDRPWDRPCIAKGWPSSMRGRNARPTRR